MFIPDHNLEIEMDASSEGWGAFCHGQMTGGCWDECEKHYHIYFLELLEVFFAIKAFIKRKAEHVSTGQVRQRRDCILSEQDGRDKIRVSHSPDKENMGLVPGEGHQSPVSPWEAKHQSGVPFKAPDSRVA